MGAEIGAEMGAENYCFVFSYIARGCWVRVGAWGCGVLAYFLVTVLGVVLNGTFLFSAPSSAPFSAPISAALVKSISCPPNLPPWRLYFMHLRSADPKLSQDRMGQIIKAPTCHEANLCSAYLAQPRHVGSLPLVFQFVLDSKACDSALVAGEA